MKMPTKLGFNKLSLGGRTFKVLRHSPKDDKIQLDGFMDPTKLEIGVSKDVPPGNAIRILFHEILHAILDDREPIPDFDDAAEELLVESLSRGLLQVFYENPKLLKFVSKTINDA